MSMPPLPRFERTALLLDLDGTLLDIAPAPDLVVVPPELIDSLRTLRNRLDGALAVITGRPVETVDALLGDAVYAVAGEHGGAIRHAPGETLERPALPAPPQGWLDEAEHLAAAFPGVILEHKVRGFGFHFRAMPEAGPALYDALCAMLAGSTEFQLLPGIMLWEVRPLGVDKGSAVDALQARPPFSGRLPVFVGDDVTDQDAIKAAGAMGGVGLWVPDVFGDAAGVRAWLAAVASAGGWSV
jgi:trehalose 6-phosphate phosphatase